MLDLHGQIGAIEGACAPGAGLHVAVVVIAVSIIAGGGDRMRVGGILAVVAYSSLVRDVAYIA